MKILLIDDDLGCLEVLEKFLSDCGNECALFQNPIEGVAAYKVNKFDLVITDIMMPEMNGIDVLKKIRSHNPEAFIIITTGYADIDNAVGAVNEGAFAFLRKPLDIKEIRNNLEKIERKLVSRNRVTDQESALTGLYLKFKDIEHSYNSLNNQKKESK
jgi:two-component system, NtrC family, response regulator HydG